MYVYLPSPLLEQRGSVHFVGPRAKRRASPCCGWPGAMTTTGQETGQDVASGFFQRFGQRWIPIGTKHFFLGLIVGIR